MAKLKVILKKYGLLLVACLMLTACVFSGTMAKYATSSDANGLTVTVAKWEVQVAGQTIDASGTVISLNEVYWTIEPYGIDETEKPIDDTIAPGTWGYAAIVIENTGEVDAVVTIEDDGAFLPSESAGGLTSGGLIFGFSTDTDYEEGAGPTDAPSPDTDPTWLTSLDSTGAGDNPGRITVPKDDKKALYVCYAWDFDDSTGSGANNAQDNALGKLEEGEDVADTFEFGTLTFTAEQAGKATE